MFSLFRAQSSLHLELPVPPHLVLLRTNVGRKNAHEKTVQESWKERCKQLLFETLSKMEQGGHVIDLIKSEDLLLFLPSMIVNGHLMSWWSCPAFFCNSKLYIYNYQNMLTTTQTAPNHAGITSCQAQTFTFGQHIDKIQAMPKNWITAIKKSLFPTISNIWQSPFFCYILDHSWFRSLWNVSLNHPIRKTKMQLKWRRNKKQNKKNPSS